ncbi:MAG: rubrerythrin [Polyangiaceae bacterium]|nr:rubrerythrin [Polyangiaceae bacterium]
MPKLEGTKTHQNLKDAFAGESQANRRYLYFAKRADIEGLTSAAALFKETADGETGHAHGHLDYLKEVGDPATNLPIGDTEANLRSAVAGETHEYETMYPGMAKAAREEGFADIAEWFETLAKAEKSHAGRFQKALEALLSTEEARRRHALAAPLHPALCHVRPPPRPRCTARPRS